jgi:hypothetical protein
MPQKDGKEAGEIGSMPEEVTGQPRRIVLKQLSWRNTFASLRHRNFRLFFSGQLISLIGTWMQNTAQGWLVYETNRLKDSARSRGGRRLDSDDALIDLGWLGGRSAFQTPHHPVHSVQHDGFGIFVFHLWFGVVGFGPGKSSFLLPWEAVLWHSICPPVKPSWWK